MAIIFIQTILVCKKESSTPEKVAPVNKLSPLKNGTPHQKLEKRNQLFFGKSRCSH